jgi:O-antigen/teichoic acid export membrane protein
MPRRLAGPAAPQSPIPQLPLGLSEQVKVDMGSAEQTLTRRAKSAAIWSGLDVTLRQALQLGFSIALARLLGPAEFGTVAILYIFSGIAATFVDSGMSSALIQKRAPTRVDESTVFWFNLLMGVVMAACLSAASRFIAAFYHLPILVPLSLAMAGNIVISALGSIHVTILNKRLYFRTQAKINAVAVVLSGSTAVALAVKGLGVWSIVAQTIVANAVTTTALWSVSSWRPGLAVSFRSARSLISFGSYLLLAQIIDIAYSRAYTLIIAKIGTPSDLGYYERANSTQQLPAGLLNLALNRVSFPVISQAAEDRAKLSRGVRMALRGVMLVNVPAMLGLAAASDSLVLSFFGAKWAPAIPLLRILCIAGLFWPLHGINLSVVMAQGYSSLVLRLEVVKVVVGLALLAAGSVSGTTGIAWSVACYGGAAFCINAHYSDRHLGYGRLAQILDVAPIFAVSLPMSLAVYFLGRVLHTDAWVCLIAQVCVVVTIFLLLSWIVRLDALSAAVRSLRLSRTGAL